MKIGTAARLLFLFVGLPVFPAIASTQAISPADANLQYVVLLSRHGVRPPLNKPGEIDSFSAAPWPQWEVPPGYLTPHGFQLMKIFGAWDRASFARKGLFSAEGCGDAARVTILADSDERTRETGKALAQGMFPGCIVEVHAKPEGTPDPLFRESEAGNAMIAAAIAGRLGGNAGNLTAALRPQLDQLDSVLAGCGKVPGTNPKRTSIFDVPAGIGPSGNLHGPVRTGSTFVENFLLEYTDGKPDVAWGCVDGAKLRALMQIDTASWEYGTRTRAFARAYASSLIEHIEKSMEQSVTGKPVAGALGKPGDRLLILVGHDTNIATVSGALGIDWIIDGRINDTPPGGALLFELWKPRNGGQPFVRIEYTAQTLEQMRDSQQLSPSNRPAAALIFVPGCSSADSSCTWRGFADAVQKATQPSSAN
jgi:4-phytase / acid phosphatase